jgi:hypothetical protein
MSRFKPLGGEREVTSSDVTKLLEDISMLSRIGPFEIITIYHHLFWSFDEANVFNQTGWCQLQRKRGAFT